MACGGIKYQTKIEIYIVRLTRDLVDINVPSAATKRLLIKRYKDRNLNRKKQQQTVNLDRFHALTFERQLNSIH
jgi:hypothetical protein